MIPAEDWQQASAIEKPRLLVIHSLRLQNYNKLQFDSLIKITQATQSTYYK